MTDYVRHSWTFEADNKGLARHLQETHHVHLEGNPGCDAGTWSFLDDLHRDAHNTTVLSLGPLGVKYIAALLRNDRARRIRGYDHAVSHGAILRREFALENIEAIDALLAQLNEGQPEPKCPTMICSACYPKAPCRGAECPVCGPLLG